MPGHLIDAAFEKTTYHAMYVKYNARTPKHLAEVASGKTTYQHLDLRHYEDLSFDRGGIWENNIFCILGNVMTSIWQRWH
jgi:hypothetical protein